MAGFLSYSLTGTYLLFLSLLETLSLFNNNFSPSLLSLTPLSLFLFSSLYLLHSLITLSLSSIPLSSLALLTSVSLLHPSLSPLAPLLSLSSFLVDLLFFYLNPTNAFNLESHYYFLALVPILVCLACSAILVVNPESSRLRLGRAVGLAMHGTWVMQMAFSFFTSAVTHGCFYRREGRGFGVVCKGHEELHRGKAIATLQFNCHLAMVLGAAIGIYVLINKIRNEGGGKGYRKLEPSKEMERFSLEADDVDEEDKIGNVVLPVSDLKALNGRH